MCISAGFYPSVTSFELDWREYLPHLFMFLHFIPYIGFPTTSLLFPSHHTMHGPVETFGFNCPLCLDTLLVDAPVEFIGVVVLRHDGVPGKDAAVESVDCLFIVNR